ncbi:MAG TPA: hypothetical protein VGC89_07020 [Pyrinomonadaceae bacterium]|jgi:hypothetical protein
MKNRSIFAALAMLAMTSGLLLSGCGGADNTKTNVNGAPSNQTPAQTKPASIPKGAPLPDNAFKAVINATNAPATLTAGQQATVSVRLRNGSDVAWPAAGDQDGKYQVKLGNHWLDARSQPVVVDDGRTPLPADLQPGAEIELPLIVTAPAKPGDYILQLDIVQENVAWSGDKGNNTFKVKVQVK